MDQTKKVVVICDKSPAVAGVLAHLLHVVINTPIINSQIGKNLLVANLGPVEFDSPIASLVISEQVEIPVFDPGLHLAHSQCVVSITGCDSDLLEENGIIQNGIPIFLLPLLISQKVDQKALNLVSDGGMILESGSLDEMAKLIADCVYAFCKQLLSSVLSGSASGIK